MVENKHKNLVKAMKADSKMKNNKNINNKTESNYKANISIQKETGQNMAVGKKTAKGKRTDINSKVEVGKNVVQSKLINPLLKGMKDARFRKNENALLEAFFDECECGTDNISVCNLARRAGICRTTVYIHHHTIIAIMPDYEEYVLALFGSEMRIKLKRENIQLKSLYLDMIIFIMKYKRIFELFLKNNNKNIIAKMVEILKPKLIAAMRITKDSDKLLRLHIGSIVELITMWEENGFRETEVSRLIGSMIYLTNSARERLGVICG